MRRTFALSLLISLTLAGCQRLSAQPSSATIVATDDAPTSTPPPIPANDGNDSADTENAFPTDEAFVPTLVQLTQPGCCVQPFWSSDGQMVLFIDKPQPTAQTGIYGVPLTGGDPQMVSQQVGLPSRDGRYRAYLNEDGETVVEPFNSEVQWIIPNGGLRVFFSPQSVRLAWTEVPRSGNFDERRATISIADIDGSNPKEVITIFGGGIAGWMDDDNLLVSGKDRPDEEDVQLFSLNVHNGKRIPITSNERIRSVEVSPGGDWIFYTVTLDPDGPEEDGLWIVKRDGSQPYRVQVVGGAHWRDATRLLIIPLELDVTSHTLWEFDAETGQAYALTNPELTPFKVANGDWSIAPGGDHIVFYGEDQALWLLSLPWITPPPLEPADP
jgi:hypothetical protein